jgi:uncharacterized protein YecE (DUF72 family)
LDRADRNRFDMTRFLASPPRGWRYAVEVRNADYLVPDYCTLLSEHNVAHVYNTWTRMPALEDQALVPETFTADFTVVRALLAKGRLYEQAVNMFEPYRLIHEVNQPAREGMAAIANQAHERKKPAFLLVNNRLEGHAPTTIEATADRLVI